MEDRRVEQVYQGFLTLSPTPFLEEWKAFVTQVFPNDKEQLIAMAIESRLGKNPSAQVEPEKEAPLLLVGAGVRLGNNADLSWLKPVNPSQKAQSSVLVNALEKIVSAEEAAPAGPTVSDFPKPSPDATFGKPNKNLPPFPIAYKSKKIKDGDLPDDILEISCFQIGDVTFNCEDMNYRFTSANSTMALTTYCQSHYILYWIGAIISKSMERAIFLSPENNDLRHFYFKDITVHQFKNKVLDIKVNNKYQIIIGAAEDRPDLSLTEIVDTAPRHKPLLNAIGDSVWNEMAKTIGFSTASEVAEQI